MSFGLSHDIYEDDGYFDPRMITPRHFLTKEEIIEEEFYESLREKELERLRRKRMLQDGDDDGGDGTDDPYDPNPGMDDDQVSTCTLDGSGNAKGDNFCCIPCNPESMKLCQILGGRLIEDRYGKARNPSDDTCKNLEDRAERLGKQVFGPTKTFRDTPGCRRLVYDYTCLWWGSNNDVYTNNCDGKEEKLFDDTIVSVADPPCLGYCTEVANTCANRPDWIKLCEGMTCESGSSPSSSSEEAIRCKEGPTQDNSGTTCDKYPINFFYAAGEKAGVAVAGAMG
eukprot:CAMPEP_0118650508 /NCGR_PEP_ID=MMETSP0785-20121206/10285_1 /TAXON_ID=91992 /ORGANISM="Bolidomonas pacifica, Strain CCMP 1866" /LENGTH=282 /DNA_ID=CAMNT_0006542889 /DNA_START=157 /DNA_END=1001 /DNA_ORIENTATION=-